MKAFKSLRGVATVACVAMILSLGTTSGALAAAPPQVDPFAPQATLTASDEIGHSLLGSAAALSHDGNTALIGGPIDNEGVGAAWVFTRRGSTWTEQAKLTGGEETDAGRFGASVALSSDGKTALIGGPGDDEQAGAAWVFTRSGSTWTQQAKLTGSGESDNARFGASVALAADGKTALISGPNDNRARCCGEGVGAAWVFTRSGSTWTQQGEKLTGSGEIGEGTFGTSVALNSPGDTALIGGPRDGRLLPQDAGESVGAAWVFTRSGSTWTQQAKLTGSGESNAGKNGGAEFGRSVALGADGKTALIGGPRDNTVPLPLEGGPQGAAWVFARSDSTWTQQVKLTGNGQGEGGAEFGTSVALSANSKTALIGGPQDAAVGPRFAERPGAAWVFTGSGSTWTQQGEKLTGADEVRAEVRDGPWNGGDFGASVALNSLGDTALIGGPRDAPPSQHEEGGAGSAWVFVNRPPHK